MSDLISRSMYKSKLLKALDILNKEYREAILNEYNDLILAIKNQQSAYMIALRLLDNEPTTYDIEKVVEELEERADFLKDCTKYGNKNAKQQAESYNTMMMYEVADLVDDLIEIVNQGGVDDDVCEWKVFDNSLADESPQWVYETTCGKYVSEEHTSNSFVYCPYCGKKIKAVE